MAKQNNSTSSIETNAFSKGMQKDLNASFQDKENYSHARNAANNSVDGDVGVIGNEPANLECARIPYTIIGAIHTYGDEWVIYSTDDSSSEIGLFDDSKCEYKTLVNDDCLSFNRKHLITGAAKENYDCSWQVYWDDGNNPSRTLNLSDIPYIQVVTSPPGADCIIYSDTAALDCEKIRLAPLLDTPCVKLSKGSDGGQLRNGSYQVYVAYVVNEQKVTDYIGVSNIQSLFDHSNNGGSLDIEVSNLDKEFEFFELVIFADNQGTKVAKKIGIYSTEQSNISIDFIDNALVAVELKNLFLRNPAYEKSESMYVVNDYLIRQGPTEQFDFNYQPLANKIQSNWVVAEFNHDYYFKGGNKTQFMRDEVYAFFIRFIYNTGEKSASYHIPGRAPKLNGTDQYGGLVGGNGDELGFGGGFNALSASEQNYQVFNTATINPGAPGLGDVTGDGGTIIAKGEMGYWESTERYPATQPEIWDDLCGKNIRHHKMPTEELASELELSSGVGLNIRILGVEFSNIERPKFNDGTYIPNIVGYEILRGSRLGAKSILAKGIFRNMREYDIPDSGGNIGPKKGLYPNYPYNDLRSDVYFHDGTGSGNILGGINNFLIDPLPKTEGCDDFGDSISNFPPLTGYRKDIFTFHSPELMFTRPFLSPYEVRIYGAYGGKSEGSFIKSEKHPQNKLLRNGASLVAGLIGVGYAIAQMQGTQETVKKDAKNSNLPWLPIWVQPVIAGTNFGGVNPVALLSTTGGTGGSVAANVILDAALDEGAKILDVTATGGAASDIAFYATAAVQQGLGLVPGMESGSYERTYKKDNDAALLPVILKIFSGLIQSSTHVAVGAQKIIDLLYNLVSEEDFAFKYNSHGLFDSYYSSNPGDRFRTRNVEANYLGNVFQTFNSDFKINNLTRPATVAIQTEKDLPIPQDLGAPVDISRFTIGGDGGSGASGDFGNDFIKSPNTLQRKDISALYGSLKFNFENQYGQLDGVKQVVMNTCFSIDPTNEATLYSTTPIFSGDTYVGRYTEKVIMPIFTDFLLGQPDQYPYNYLQRINIPYPRFWMDTRKYDTTKLAKEITSLGFSGGAGFMDGALPNDLFYLDRGSGTCVSGFSSIFSNAGGNPVFAMRYGYMYTHCNGILDFFIESEVNTVLRDWDDTPQGRYFNNFEETNYEELFNAQIIKEDNKFKYDFSLSASRFATNLTSAGTIQPRDYDPEIAETCFTSYPKRLIYSLQAQEEAKKDFWRVFLPNNYKDFKNRVNVIKAVNKSGAIIFFPYQSPQMFQGVDQLQTELGTKVTLGDGGLFNQAMQNLVNSELPNEYGSCESQRGVINTPMGFFFISQAQGRIFQQSGQGLQAISNQGMKWWFAKYLPSNLIKQYPELEFSKLSDNPIVGVGCQVTYDITDDIAYFCKRDFSVKDEFINAIEFDAELDSFIFTGEVLKPDPNSGVKTTTETSGKVEADLEGIAIINPYEPPGASFRIPVELGDPLYFNDCSWTVSYDPKAQAWISFHDWHPELCMSSINHFLTTNSEKTDVPQCPPGYAYNESTRLCEKPVEASEPALVTIDELPMATGGCPPGYTYNGTICEKIETTAIICEPTQYSVVKSGTSVAYGDFGTRFYDDATGRPLPITTVNTGTVILQDAGGTELPVDIYLDDDPNSPFAQFWKQRLNEIGIWTTSDNPAPPMGEWIGFTKCIDVPETKVYSVLIAADNDCRFKVDGEVIVEMTNSYVDNFKYMHVIPITLTAGTHVIHIEGKNSSSIAAFGAEIYDKPPSYLATIQYQQILDACTIFTTLDKVGDTFDTGESSGCACPEGFVLANCDGELQCINVLTAPSDCQCPEGYTQVYYDSVNRTYTLPEGPCPGEPQPICRKVECDCPPGPVEGSIPIETGDCPDIYQIGDPTYVNPNPRMCEFLDIDSVRPSNILGGIWRHNYRCDLFANYYGVDYPWEIELIENTGQNVNTLRSVEYQLESYVYKGDLFNGCGDDRWHDLDFNFDEAIVYNSEQVSGLLRLNLDPKEDPLNRLSYPIINSADIDILYSKVEQKYRFNQFWDVTNDRGEFTNSEQQILITKCNGYIRELNENNIDYNKTEDQRKKFRHYYNKVLLRRELSNDRKMLLKLVNSKLNLSFR